MAVLWIVAVAVVTTVLIVGDLRHRHLANRWVLGLTALAVLGLAFVSPPGDGGSLAWALGAGMMALTGGLVLYGLGLVGAGDVKVAPGVVSLITWFGATAWLIHLGCMILVGAATLAWLLGRRRSGHPAVIPLAPTLLGGLVPSMVVAVLVLPI